MGPDGNPRRSADGLTFLDDRVIEACLAVRPGERVSPGRYKPVLGAAMCGIVPEECLRRSNKATASMDVRTLLDGGEETDADAALPGEFAIDRAQAVGDVEALVQELRRSGPAS